MRTLVVTLIVLLPVSPLAACLWDSETLLQERERFPNTLELITGKFLRHSDEYYRWRLDDRLAKLNDDPDNDRWLDDVAVSHEKLGEHQEAIAIAKSQLERNPDRYESLANIGTFLIHDGQYQKGLEFIDRALEVNPDAHFGREKYQRALVRYILKMFPDGKIEFPIVKRGAEPIEFDSFLAQELVGEKRALNHDEIQEAIRGVSGMMRFSRHDHPVLLEVLAQLLHSQFDPGADAKRLAARAYFQASYVVDDESAKAGYREFARSVLSMQVASQGSSTPVKPAVIEKTFKQELADASSWFAELEKNESTWITSGADVDAEFQKHYRDEPKSSGAGSKSARERNARVIPLIAAGIFLAIAGVLYVTRKMLLKRGSRSAIASAE